MTSAALIALQEQEKAKRTRHEDALAMQLRALKLDGGLLREFVFYTPRRWRFDFAYPELKVAVEVEGGIWIQGRHSRGKGMQNDMEKYNQATVMGWSVLRVSGDHISSGLAAQWIEHLLNAKGAPS